MGKSKEDIEKQRKERLGESKVSKFKSKMAIVEYNNAKNIIVEFENGYKVESSYGCFKKGNIKSPYDKTVYGIGYIGEGNYTTFINSLKCHTIQYETWRTMLKRCYDEKYHKKYPTYKDCSVCEEWHNFQVFAKWFDENYYEVENDRVCLDKDILFKGNKVYSPETCVFVPNRINSLFTKSNKIRGQYPIGVYLYKKTMKFKSQCSIIKPSTLNKIQKGLGSFNTPEEAFLAYKVFKEHYIKQVADEYKDKIPLKLYKAMYRYIVEITD